MSHKAALKALHPLEIGPVGEQILEVKGRQFDHALARAVILKSEIFPDVITETLTDWERICGITPGASDPVQLRKSRVIQKLREKGDIKAPYYVSLAAALGFTIVIERLSPFMAGWGRAGDILYQEVAWWQWMVTVLDTPAFNFRAGQSVAGERLTWWAEPEVLVAMFASLKPADIYVQLTY